MTKFAIALAAMSLAFTAPAFAVDWQCNQADLDAMKADVGKLDSKASQEEGAKEWDLASAAMKSNNMEECTVRMTNVNKLLGGTNLERKLDTANDKNNNPTGTNNAGDSGSNNP